MAKLTIKIDNILENIKKLGSYLSERDIDMTLVTKVLGGHEEILEKIVQNEEAMSRVHSIADSRHDNMRTIKKINPNFRTMYIRPPTIEYLDLLVKYSDISTNTSRDMLREINKEAKRQGKTHDAIIMIELGELREGVLPENIVQFYKDVFELSNVNIIGLGTNLGCMHGVEPTQEKMNKLKDYAERIEKRFNVSLTYLSGGGSNTLPLIEKGDYPIGLNHLRIGEAIFFGAPPGGTRFLDLSQDIFGFKAYPSEVKLKDAEPEGEIGDGNVGHIGDVSEKGYRILLNFGTTDLIPEDLRPEDKKLEFYGTTSDLTVYHEPREDTDYSIYKRLHFKLPYRAASRLFTSPYIDVEVI